MINITDLDFDEREEPEEFFADFMANLYVPDSTRPKIDKHEDKWIIPINFDKLYNILDDYIDEL